MHNTQNFYFTFGSDPLYPYHLNDYVMVNARNIDDACLLFSLVHPKRPGSNAVNCAFIYTEQRFNEFRDKYYKDVEPVEFISLNVQKGEG